MQPTINTVGNCIDKSLADREKNISKLVVCINKDVAQLNLKLKEVKQEAQVRLN